MYGYGSVSRWIEHPRNSGADDKENLLDSEESMCEGKDDEEHLGPDIPFTSGGDSSALVYAREDNIMIPLGLHLGSPAAWPYTPVFVSMETVCYGPNETGLPFYLLNPPV